MEEKERFEYYPKQNQLYDKTNDELYCLGIEQDKTRLVEFLNLMNEDWLDLYERNKELEEENQQLKEQIEETKQTGSYQVMLMCQKENILLKQQLKSQPKEIVEKIKNICCIEDKCEDGSFVLGINEKDLDTILKEYEN